MENLLLSIAGGIIIILLSANGYFLKKWIESTDQLTDSVNALKTAVAIFSSKHVTIEKRLNAHSQKINEHSVAIAELQTEGKRQIVVKKSKDQV